MKRLLLFIYLLPFTVWSQTHVEYSFDTGPGASFVTEDVTASEFLATGLTVLSTTPNYTTTGHSTNNARQRYISFTLTPQPRHVLRLTTLSIDLKVIKKTSHNEDIVFDVRYGKNNSSLQKITIESIQNENEYQITTLLYLPAKDFMEVTAPITFNFYTNTVSTDEVTLDNIGISGLTFLPVDLVSFTGTSDKGLNSLKWVTASEKNVQEFEVQRSVDSKAFTKAGTVAATNGSTKKEYQYKEKNLQPLTYYRLKAIDKDGSYKYSKVIAIRGQDTNIIQVANPSTATLSIYAGQKDVSLNIFDAAGKTLRTYKLKVGQNKVNTGLANGIYIARYTWGGLVLKSGLLLIQQ